MDPDILAFFDGMPQALPLYLALEQSIVSRFAGVRVGLRKTQISFYNRHGFAMASLPLRRRKGWPRICLVVSFGLGRPLDSPRIAAKSEPYPGRWTHHVLVEKAQDLDEELMGWIEEAYAFALIK